MRNNLLSCLIAISLITAPVAVFAKKSDEAGKEKHQSEKQSKKSSGKKHSESKEEMRQDDKKHRFSGDEQRKVREYYLDDKSVKGKEKNKQKSIPPGLQKKLERSGQLPPGWQNKVAIGEVLDSDLYSRSEPLPDELGSVLNRAAGEEHRRIGHKVIKVLEGDATIIDVIDILDGM